jgi:hypothetical protein
VKATISFTKEFEIETDGEYCGDCCPQRPQKWENGIYRDDYCCLFKKSLESNLNPDTEQVVRVKECLEKVKE